MVDKPSPLPTLSPEGERALTCTRVTPRQATSHTAYHAPEPDADDPLLSFTPVPHKAPRSNSLTPERQRAFIAHLAATGIVTQAARHIGKSVEAIYKLRHRPGAEEFSAAWDMALDRGVERMEDGALARAIEGVEVPLIYHGEVRGSYRKHNDNLVMFFLRQRRSARYSKDGVGMGDLAPGHPVYDRIAAEVLEARREYESTYELEDEILTSLNAKLDALADHSRRQKAGAKGGAEGGAKGGAGQSGGPSPNVDNRL